MLYGKKLLFFTFALLLGTLIAAAPTSADAATIYIYQGKGIGVMADTTSRCSMGMPEALPVPSSVSIQVS